MGRTQHGNNNAYCQDNAISWFDWNLTAAQEDLLAFTQYLIRTRLQYALFHRRNFFQDRRIRGAGVEDIRWFEPSGQEMTDDGWNAHFVRCLGVKLNGAEAEEPDDRREHVSQDSLFVMFNAHHERVYFVLPDEPEHQWERLLDSSLRAWSSAYRARKRIYRLAGRSVAVFRLDRSQKVRVKPIAKKRKAPL